MKLRRRPKPERVRQVKASLPDTVASTYADEIIRLRRAMIEAANLIDSDPPAAQHRLRTALRGETWWVRS